MQNLKKSKIPNRMMTRIKKKCKVQSAECRDFGIPEKAGYGNIPVDGESSGAAKRSRKTSLQKNLCLSASSVKFVFHLSSGAAKRSRKTSGILNFLNAFNGPKKQSSQTYAKKNLCPS